MTSISVALFGVLAILISFQILFDAFSTTLRHVPGPFIAKVTQRWLMLIELAGNRTSTIHRLHQRYGSSVRIGPREISYSNPEMVDEIYGLSTPYLKAPIYDTFSLQPLGIFAMRDRFEHSQRRRLLSHAFSQSNLLETEPLIMQQIEKLLIHVKSGLGRPVDVLTLFRLTSFDIVGELFLGQSFGGLDSAETPQFLHDMDYHFMLSGLEVAFPWLYRVLVSLPILASTGVLRARERIQQYGKLSFDKYIGQYGRDSGRKDLLTKILNTPSENEAPMTDRQICAEIANLVFAGTDTTSTTLTYLFWELARHRGWQTRLRAELPQAAGAEELPSYKEITDLPILDAVINEALRLHPAAPASLQRVVPPGGRSLNGVFVPEKTTVSMQCFTVHRNPDAFPEPDLFKPERWLNQEKVTATMKTAFMPFSQGPRACLGKNLAMMELKMITAILLKGCVVDLAPRTTEDSMAMTDHFLAIPKSGKCELIFKRVCWTD